MCVNRVLYCLFVCLFVCCCLLTVRVHGGRTDLAEGPILVAAVRGLHELRGHIHVELWGRSGGGDRGQVDVLSGCPDDCSLLVVRSASVERGCELCQLVTSVVLCHCVVQLCHLSDRVPPAPPCTRGPIEGVRLGLESCPLFELARNIPDTGHVSGV